jgi:hypothetical protein
MTSRTIGARGVRYVGLVLCVTALVACSAGTQSASIRPSEEEAGSASPAASGPAELPAYHEGSPRSIPAGTYLTGSTGFFPGLALTIPDGWTVTEADAGEIGLHPAGRPDDSLLIWKDMAAVVTNDRDKTVGQVRDDIGRTSDALLTWLTTTTDFAILEQPGDVSVGDSIQGTQLTLGVSDSANFAWDDCPDNPRCAAIFTDPAHWGHNFYAIGGDEVARIFIASVHYADGDHTFFVVLDAPNQAELVTLGTDAEPIIRSLKLPGTYIDT